MSVGPFPYAGFVSLRLRRVGAAAAMVVAMAVMVVVFSFMMCVYVCVDRQRLIVRIDLPDMRQSLMIGLTFLVPTVAMCPKRNACSSIHAFFVPGLALLTLRYSVRLACSFFMVMCGVKRAKCMANCAVQSSRIESSGLDFCGASCCGDSHEMLGCRAKEDMACVVH